MPDARASNQPYPHGALPVGTRLGEFEIRSVLGVGGFGIVYRAFDHLLEREVALKEYMPSTLVDRADTMHVSLISQAHADTFALGLRSFVNEARLLARFDHPSLLKVHRFWEANGTAYMAMALYKGRTVRDVRLAMQTRPDEAWVRKILEPLLGAIERLHSEDVFHRDIAPDNILLEADGRPVLLDFGAARRVITDRSQALTAILKPSYAPIEQYADVGGMKQGAWTDIYALGATMHFLLMGKPPPPAPGRSIQDTLPPLASQDLVGCSKPFLELIDWMLTPLPNERPQSVDEVREALAGRLTPPHKAPPASYERTEPLPGAGGRPDLEGATVVMPRGQAARPPAVAHGDEATIIMPRQGSTAYQQPRPPAPAVADDDATVVQPYPTAYQTQRPPPVPPPPPPRPTEMPPLDAGVTKIHQTATARPPAGRTMHVPAMTLPPSPPTPAPAKSPLLPILAGVGVAVLVGGGLWWFLTRPVAPPVLPAPPAASQPAAVEPAREPAPTVTPPAPTPVPAAASSVATPPIVPPPEVAAPVPTTTPAGAKPGTAASPQPRRPEPTPGGQRPGATPPAPPTTQTAPAPTPTPAPPVSTAPAPTPSPAPAPAPEVAKASAPDDNRPKSPSERCAKELPLVRLICIDLACNRSEFNKHPECIKLRAEQANKRMLDGN